MRESDLYVPVRDWLAARGYAVYVERFGADVVAVRGGELTVVALKLCLTQGLMEQLGWRAQWADYVIAAVASEPKHLSGLRYAGYGLLQVRDGKARQRLVARPQPWLWHRKHDYRAKKLAGEAPAMAHEVAGLPSCPQLRQQRRQRADAQTEGYFKLITGGAQ